MTAAATWVPARAELPRAGRKTSEPSFSHDPKGSVAHPKESVAPVSLDAVVSRVSNRWRQSEIRNPPQSKIRCDPTRRLEVAKALLAEYEQRIGHRRRGRRFATGLAGLDAALGGGLAHGALCEITAAAVGVGAMSLALTVARAAAGRRPVFLIDPRGEFYPPAAAAMGVMLERLVILRPDRRTNAVWAMEQTLRCGAVGAVIGLLDSIDPRAARHLQLAAEAGGGVGLLVRCDDRSPGVKFAAVRMIVEGTEARRHGGTKGWGIKPSRASVGESHDEYKSQNLKKSKSRNLDRRRCVRVRVVKSRSGTATEPFVLELGDATGDVRVSAVSGDRLGDESRRQARVV